MPNTIARFLEALVDYLQDDAGVAAQVSTRVFGLELPADEAEDMPRKTIVVQLAGGPGRRDLIDVIEQRIDILNYGETPLEALDVQHASREAMRAILRTEKNQVLFYWACQSGGPVWLKDNDGKWPLIVESFMIMAAEYTTTPS